MSDNQNMSVAEVLISSVVKSVGKREFLKTVEKLYGDKESSKEHLRIKTNVPADEKCMARVKGDRIGMKIGRYVIFDSLRCERKEVNENHLCAIHSNQVTKFGELPYGLHSQPITDELKKVFGEI